MIRYLTGYTSGVTWFDWAADITTGALVATVVAYAVWWVWKPTDD